MATAFVLPREGGFPEAEPDLTVLTADGDDPPLTAHFDVLRLFSSCVAGLPRPSDGSSCTWDLRGARARR